MDVEPLSNAGSLRVIGQYLADLGINSFDVVKIDDGYVVKMDGNEFADKSAEKPFLKSLFNKGQQSPESPSKIPNPVRFSPSEIFQADFEKRMKRRVPTGMPDTNNLSTILRVLGDYLDRKLAGDFAIACDGNLVTVNYGEKRERFRPDYLYDLGVHMYLRRSSRYRAP